MNTIHIKVPRYMCAYYEKKFGKPCIFEQKSVVWSYLRIFLQSMDGSDGDEEWNEEKWRLGTIEENGVHYDWLEIKLPSRSDGQNRFTYLAPRGRNAIVKLLRDIMCKHIWTDFSSIITENANVQTVVSGWCEANGIGIEDEVVVRQIFYRQREYLGRKGVRLKKNVKNRKK